MQIISLIKNKGSNFYGFAEDQSNYIEFRFNSNSGLDILSKYDKSEYSDYMHFANVMLKFCPEVPFLLEPIECQELIEKEFDRVYSIIDSL